MMEIWAEAEVPRWTGEARTPRARARGRAAFRYAGTARNPVRIAGWFLRLLEFRPRPAAARRRARLAVLAAEVERELARMEKRAAWMGGEMPPARG